MMPSLEATVQEQYDLSAASIRGNSETNVLRKVPLLFLLFLLFFFILRVAVFVLSKTQTTNERNKMLLARVSVTKVRRM